MTDAVLPNPTKQQPIAPATQTTPALRVWPAVAIVGAYWAFRLISARLDRTFYGGFMSLMVASATLLLLFLIWWLVASRASVRDRLLGLALVVVAGAVAGQLADPSMNLFGMLFFAVPVVLSASTAWLVLTRRSSRALQRGGLLVAVCLAWGYFTLVRMDGVRGDQGADIHWRWDPKAEDLFLAERAQAGEASAPVARQVDAPREALTLQDGDWPAFRGPLRDGAQSGKPIDTDWTSAPPKLLWKQRVGPAWSSVAIVGNRLFTQEQRGEMEAIVCLDAATGKEIWVHEDAARFWEAVAGAGPRATPTFADGCIFTFGAKGVLNCLDAASGDVKWSRDVVADSAVPVPMWGFSSSPLVVDGIVVIAAGGEKGNGLLAYRCETGEPVWTAPTGKHAYSSPQLTTIGGASQVLFLSEAGLAAFDPASGKILWEYAAVSPNWRAVQPHPTGDTQILIGSEDLGLVLLDISHKDDVWTPIEVWTAKSMKPAYNDFVVHDGYVYGFDGGVFGCVELKTGKRSWKKGRYGHGQVLLLADQNMLVVLSETGEAVLVSANPEKLEELGRFQAIQGKTWNHPVVAHGRLYARNDEEMACYELQPATVR